jgi:hypothetical protein
MIRGKDISLDDVSKKAREAAGRLKSPAYLLDRHDGYHIYAAPGEGKLELIAEAAGLGSFVRGLGAFDATLRATIGSRAASLPEGMILAIDGKGRPVSLTQRL